MVEWAKQIHCMQKFATRINKNKNTPSFMNKDKDDKRTSN